MCWHDPKLGAVPTHEVIRAAEGAYLIDTLILPVLATAVRDRAALVRESIDVNVAFNVSMHNLYNVAIFERMYDIITAAGDQPSKFTLEITETHHLMVT